MKPAAPILRGRVLDVLQHSACGMTPDEVADRLGMSVLSIRPRFTELKKDGDIVDTGERRDNASGRKAIVWRAKK